MALRTATIAAAAGVGSTEFALGLTWPPLQPVAIGDPAGTDPTGPYPIRDSIISTELIAASSPTLSPENRVTEYIDSRTETLRELGNQLVRLANLLPFYFLDRDGEANVETDGTTPAPSFMRRNMDMGGFRITDVADGVDVQDAVSRAQMLTVLFRAEDDVEQILDAEIIRRDGTIAMARPLDMDGSRLINLLLTPTAPLQAQPKGHFDTQIAAIQLNYLNRIGNQPMQANLSMQDGGIAPRFRPVNVGFPTANGDAINLFYLNQQLAISGVNGIPVGCVFHYFGPSGTVPAPYLLCDGREVSRIVYQNLFFVIGTAYGPPSSVNVFRLPDLRGRAIAGIDKMGNAGKAHRLDSILADAPGYTLGEERHSLVLLEMAVHSHSYDDAQASHGVAGALQGAPASDADNTVSSTSRTTSSTGSGTAHPNMQPSMAVNYMIRY